MRAGRGSREREKEEAEGRVRRESEKREGEGGPNARHLPATVLERLVFVCLVDSLV